jgi:hypothetical protein
LLKGEAELTECLCKLVSATPWLMDALCHVRALGLPSWCIGAGAVRNLVWDAAHDKPLQANAESDVDVAYFDPTDTRGAQDAGLQARLKAACSYLDWEVTNQAGVHEWYADHYGYQVPPLRSLEDALASWPETATAVGIWLDEDDRLHVVAPLGLADLFGLVVRHNPACVSAEVYHQRLASKRYQARWPKLHVIAE